MKKCPYCGAEYRDDVVVCPVDHTSFKDAHLECVSGVRSLRSAAKPKHFVIGSISLLIILYLTVIGPAIERERMRTRAELHLLNTIKAGVSQHLYAGGELPTNWLSLSNAVDWELAVSICERYHLPPPTELYTVLRKPVDLDNYFHSVFLVRTKPCNQPGDGSGRWVLGLGHYSMDSSGQFRPVSRSNEVYRTWVSEGQLPSEIRSQLTNQAKF